MPESSILNTVQYLDMLISILKDLQDATVLANYINV